MPDWFEELPERCPPTSAYSPDNQKFYRLIPANEPKSEDFVSQRIETPFKEFQGIDECIVRSVSLHAQKEDCEKQLKFSRHKDKVVYEITLTKEDGLVKQTFKPSHHSWWRSASFKLPDTDATPL